MREAVERFRLAFVIAFDRPRALVLAAGGVLGMLSLLVVNSGGLNYYPRSGWSFFAPPGEIATMVVLAGLFGLLLPLQVAAISKARAASSAAGGVFGSILAVAGVS